MPMAMPSLSLPTVGSACTLPPVQTAGSNCRTCGAGHDVSGVDVSAYPAVTPLELFLSAVPLFPPNVGSALMVPDCQTNGRHSMCVPKPQKSSPFGSEYWFSAAPDATVLAFTPPAKLFGPPSVPRSVAWPLDQSTACCVPSAGGAPPATPRALLWG